jgi:hypothetical protein
VRRFREILGSELRPEPASYPMVAPNYAAARSELAKQMGLGARRGKTANVEPVQDEAEFDVQAERTRAA